MNSGYGENIARYKSVRTQCCGAFWGGGQLKALCTALLLGSITFGGGYAAQAIDITDQIGLTDVANYITGNQLHIKNPIALDGTAAFPVIDSANVEIYGNDNAITGAIYQYSNDGRDPLEYGHYVLRGDSDVLFDGMNFATETTIAASAGVGGEAARPDLQWNIFGGIVQNESGILNIKNSLFGTKLTIAPERRLYRLAEVQLNGGVVSNAGNASIANTGFTGNKITSNVLRYGDDSITADGARAISGINGGIIHNAQAAEMDITGGNINDNTIKAISSNTHSYPLLYDYNCEYDTAEAEIRGGLINNAGTISIDGAKIFDNNVSAEASSFSAPTTAGVLGGVLYNDGTATISNTTISDNIISASASAERNTSPSASVLGGAIYNAGTLNLDEVVFSGNKASADSSLVAETAEDKPISSALGGAIYNAGTLTLQDAVFSGNTHQNGILNDIYFAAQGAVSSVMDVLGRVEIGSGLASADDTAQINIKNGAELVMSESAFNTSTDYKGSINVESGGILTYKAQNVSDALYSALGNASKNWEKNAGLGFDFEEDIANTRESGLPVDAADTISAADIKSLAGSDDDISNLNIYKFGDNHITLSDDYSGIANTIYVKGGVLRFLVDGTGEAESYFGTDNNAATVIADGATFIHEIWNPNTTMTLGALETEGTEGVFHKAGDGTLVLTGDNSKFNGQALVEWGTLSISKDNYFGDGARVVVDSSLDGGAAGKASMIYNTSGEDIFDHDITVKNQGTLSIIGDNRDSANVSIEDGAIKFDNTVNNLNLSNADFILNTNWSDTKDQNITFNNAGLNLGSGVTSLEHTINLEAGSTLNLADNKISDVTLGDVISSGTNYINLDVDLSGEGDSDTVTVGANSTGSLSITGLNLAGNNGSVTEKEFTIINNSAGGSLVFEDYSGKYDSGIYIYDIATEGTNLKLTADAISEKGLKHQNHVIGGDREFHFVGDSQYTITEDLETTLAGNFTVSGKSDNAADSVISGDNLYSFFEVTQDNTNLNIENITIKNALALGSSAETDSADNGAVVNASTGTVTMDNVVLSENYADGNGGAISASGNSSVTVNNSELANNSAYGNGGAISASGNAQVIVNNSTFTNNTTINGEGAVIYNDGAEVTLNDVTIEQDSISDSDIFNSGTLTVNANSKDSVFTNVAVKNNKDLNLNASADKTIFIDKVSGGNLNINTAGGTYTGSVLLDSVDNVTAEIDNGSSTIGDITESDFTVNNSSSIAADKTTSSSFTLNDSSTLIAGAADESAAVISDSDLSLNGTSTLKLLGGNIAGGSINLSQGASLIAGNADTVNDITITSELLGSGVIIKNNDKTLTLSGDNNGANFAGEINITGGGLEFNQAYGLNANAVINLENAVLDYSTGSAVLSQANFADINLNGNAQANIDGGDRATSIIIGDKFWTSAGSDNSLNFLNGAYTLGFATKGISDVLNFNNADIRLTNENNGSIAVTNSFLDLSDGRNAGDNYNFDSLKSIGDSNNIGFDISLEINKETGLGAKGDTITVNNPSADGYLNLTKIFITADNGLLDPLGEKIQIIKGNNNLQLKDNNDIELLSWATNVYKYGIKSAETDKVADSIQIVQDGPSSTDTLRDLNAYPGSVNNHNRGFSFIGDTVETNRYNIYRDLDTTSEGHFTIVGKVLEDGSKSLLSGVLAPLVVEKESMRLVDNKDGTYTYYNTDGSVDKTFEAKDVSIDPETGDATIDIAAMAGSDKNGSFFELINATTLDISNVSIQNARRYQTDSADIYGSVIYANNAAAVVALDNVDFVNNISYNNGGAIGNVLSSSFEIKSAQLYGNKSENGLGGAIYTSSDMLIQDSDFGVGSDGSANLNTHRNGTANDIYIAGGNVEFKVSGENTSIINSGLAGVQTGIFTKTGLGTLSLNGNNKDMLGQLNVKEGNVEYTADSDSDSFVGGSVNIDSVLSMQINENIQNQIIKNISGSGDLVKTGEGTLTIAGTNTFDGDFLIQEGSAAFTNDGTNSYIAGITNISYGASLLYSTDSPSETISKILGSGNFVKSGTGNLTFNYVNGDDKFSGNAVAEAGTLTVNAASGASDKFDFNMLAAGGNIVYNAISGQLYTISGNSKIGFDKYSGSVTFNNGTYNLESALSGMESDNQKVIFDGGSTIKLTNTDYTKGAYILKDALIDLSDGAYNNYTFNNLSTEEGAQLKVDLSFNTVNGHNSDMLISENGTGLVTLTQLNLKDIFDDGATVPPGSVTFDILGGGLKLNENTSLQDFATDVYHYDVSISDDKQSIILTADGAAHENSLQSQNVKEHGSRNFQFLKDETYTIGDHLGNTAAGIFTVNGIKNADGTITTHIHGGEQYSMFNVVNNTQLSLNDMEISHASKDGNGSVLNHTHSEGVSSITNAYIHDSESTGLGGAVYAAGGHVVLEDVVFADNTHGTGVNASANDIYIDKSGTITYNAATTGKNSITSGIAGEGNLVKTGSSELNLSGNNKNFYGNLYVTDGTLNFTQNSADDTYIAGVTVLQEKGNAVIDAAKSDVTPGAFVGGENNEITKTGSYDMILSGDNSGFKGTANIEEGDVVYNTDTSTFFGGSTVLGAGDTGILVKGSKDALVSNIYGSGAITKENSGTLYLAGDNSNFNGTLDVTKGTFALAAGTQLGTISSGNFAAGTSINLQNTSAVQGSDGKWTTSPNPASIESVNFDTLEINGDVGLSLDVDLANSQSDKITANTVKSENDGRLVIGGNSLNIVSDSLVQDTKTQIVSGNIAQYVYLDNAARTAMGPIQKYMVDFTNDGYLSFTAQGGNTPSYGDVNPAVMASPVAAQLGGYLVQLNSYDQAFHNMDMYMLMTKEQRQAMKLRNKYASANSDVVFDPTVTRYEEKSGWFRPYATFESVRLDNGPKVSNVAYGSFFGAESELYDLGHGWDGMWGVYAGYNGSHQAYDGIGIYQNGGTLGVVGMAYKDNFFTGLTANSGASVGEAQSSFGQDNFTMLMAGIASKSGYNFELADGKLIIQPNFMMSYSFVNTFDYHNSAGVSISSDPLHAIHLEPGIKIIGNLKNGWQPYAGVSMIWNIMDNTQFMANEVSLPDLSVKPYVKYGVGVRKSWGERFTGFFQTYITNGGRNGVGLQLGFRMMFGGKPAVKNSAGSSPVKKKVIKAMK